MRPLCACYSVAVLFFLLVPAARSSETPELPTALKDYVERPEPSYEWKLLSKQKSFAGTVYELRFTSQQWQGITWSHALQVYEPAEVRHPGHVLLFVTGGSNGRRPGQGDVLQGMLLAKMCGARVATIHQVPNQPLFDGRKEDDLITETWLRYLQTGDETWPLLFPMVKSAVKAMDAVESLAAAEWKTPVEGFVITGASKRGWTSWLTPVVDERVVATAPIVIDVLNFRPQMQHQLESWGKYSEQIVDYTSKGLVKQEDEAPREARLRQMVDPYTYRQVLSLPKLLVNGTNDRYWVVDAMSLYWNDLVGPKYVLQVPNAGHNLEGGRQLAMSTIAAFFQHAAMKRPLPELRWEYGNGANELTLNLRASVPATGARLWRANSLTKDFRESKWESQPLAREGDDYVGALAKPDKGHVAYYGELEFDLAGLPYSLCTVVRVD